VAETIYIADADPVSRADVVIDHTDIDDPRVLRNMTIERDLR
jgi:hypothetical protein